MAAININDNKLLEIAYKYYPKNLDCIQNRKEYIMSEEYRNLTKCISVNKNSYSSKIKDLVLQLSKVNSNYQFRDSTFFDWQDRCYTLEFFKRVNNETFLIKFYKSILGNFYTMSCYNIFKIENREKYRLISLNNFEDQSVVDNFLNIADDNFHLVKLENDILDQIIHNLSFEDIPLGKFNFFNAFFLNQNL